MWRFTPWKAKQAADDSNTPGDVLSNVLEQHPNLSVFHSPPTTSPSPPPSPSKSNRMALFKRTAKAHDESQRAPSPMKLPIGLPKKVKSTFGVHGNVSQTSVGPSSSSMELSRATSHDMLAPPAPQAKRRSSFNFLNRPSVDNPAEPAPRAEDHQLSDPATPFGPQSGSVRSILRDRNTPGTGQNVRFFSRDAYNVLSPDQSVTSEYQSVVTYPAANTPSVPPPEESLLDRLQRSGSADSNVSGSMPRIGSGTSKPKSRPALTDVFSPMNSSAPETSTSQLMSELPPIPGPDFTFDMSQELEMPLMPPPGLGLDILMSTNEEGSNKAQALTSTPYRDKAGKGKERDDAPLAPSGVVDETIFHSLENALRLPHALHQHDRSHSFSAGQTLFYSMAHDGGDGSSRRSSTSALGDFPVSVKASPAPSPLSAKVEDSSAVKGRSRAYSDTVFMSMGRSPSGSGSPSPHHHHSAEADINDESGEDIIVYKSESPDPFSANAGTYYTSAPGTPAKGIGAGQKQHERQTSKEDGADAETIFALKTKLALQTELCAQFEADLRARDELVAVLGKKLDAVEKEENKKRGVLRTWKKKVQELERACRYLEEEVEESRQTSMERSVIDYASEEALNMLHQRIAELQRDKEGARRVEQVLRDDVMTLERLLKEKSEDVVKLRETLWSRDESERELQAGIKEAKEQMEQMGNTSVGLIDPEELKKIAGVTRDEEREKKWQDEREALVAAVEDAQLENAGLVAELDNLKQQVKDHEEELGIVKDELEAQWDHTEKAGEKAEKAEAERDAASVQMEGLQERIADLENECADSENKQIELENNLQEVWDIKEALEKERDELTAQLRAQEGEAEQLRQTLKVHEDRVIELSQERQYALDNVARLEENILRRDAEAAAASKRTLQREAEAEALQEQLSRMKREHAAALEAATAAHGVAADERARAEKERVAALKDEIERLRRQIHELQQESADKEVKIVQMTKQHAQLKEDNHGLNIALDSKQQELELIKRRMGVRGTAGATPAQPSKTAGRRDSAVFTSTPTVASRLPSRPPSVLSDAGTDTGSVNGSSSKLAALGKSTRLNATGSVAKPAVARGSMGPPAAPVAKPRGSLAGTPTPTPRFGAGVTREDSRSSLSRSASARPAGSTPAPAAAHRRVASATLDQATARAGKTVRPATPQQKEIEKENVEATTRPGSRNRVAVPA